MDLHRTLASVAILVFSLVGAAPLDPPSPQGPHIASVQIDPSPIHPGDEVAATVATSTDVVAVDALVRGFTFHLDATDSGLFHKTAHVPKIARFFKGTYHVRFIARSSSGQTTESECDIVLN